MEVPEIGWSAAKDTRSAMDGKKYFSQSTRNSFSDQDNELAVWVCRAASLGAYQENRASYVKNSYNF